MSAKGKYFLVGMVTTIAFFLVGRSIPLTGIRCRITNSGKVPLRRFSVESRGSLDLCRLIEPGDTVTCRVSPSIASDLVFEFTRHSGIVEKGRIDVYLTPGSRGSICLDVGTTNGVPWVASIRQGVFEKKEERKGFAQLSSLHIQKGTNVPRDAKVE